MENEKYIVNGYLRNICDNLKNLLNNILTMNI